MAMLAKIVLIEDIMTDMDKDYILIHGTCRIT